MYNTIFAAAADDSKGYMGTYSVEFGPVSAHPYADPGWDV